MSFNTIPNPKYTNIQSIVLHRDDEGRLIIVTWRINRNYTILYAERVLPI